MSYATTTLQSEKATTDIRFDVSRCCPIQRVTLRHSEVHWETLCSSSDPFSVPRISRFPTVMRNLGANGSQAQSSSVLDLRSLNSARNLLDQLERNQVDCQGSLTHGSSISHWKECFCKADRYWLFVMEICSAGKYWTLTQVLLTLSATFPESI